MPDITLNCAEARRQIQDYVAGEPCPGLAAHLSGCEECRQAYIESALREPPAVTVPPRFAAQVLAQLPPDQPERSWAPVAAVILFALLGIVLWWRGDAPAVAEAMLRWQVLIAMAALETCVALAWVWRVATRQE
jgi:hypothetical protein